jgi:hypothetical protein
MIWDPLRTQGNEADDFRRPLDEWESAKWLRSMVSPKFDRQVTSP